MKVWKILLIPALFTLVIGGIYLLIVFDHRRNRRGPRGVRRKMSNSPYGPVAPILRPASISAKQSGPLSEQ